MARVSIGQKAQRTLRFLMGVRNPRIAAVLAAHGFSEKELREGIDHLAALTRLRLNAASIVEDSKLIDELDSFENRWFPIARATLERHYPQLAELFFHNLAQTSGMEVAITVATFLERVHELEDPNGSFGAEGQAARALLAARGLTDEVIKAAQTELDKLASFSPGDSVPAATEQQAELEAAMWAWYKEWSGIARAAIDDRRLLRSLGFLRPEHGSENAAGAPALATSSAPEPLRLPPSAAGTTDTAVQREL